MLEYFLLFPFLYSCFQLVAYVRAYEGEQREKENKQKTKEIQIKTQAKSQEGKWHSPLTLLYFCFNFFWFRKLLVSIHKVLFFSGQGFVEQKLPLLEMLFFCRAATNIFFTTIKPIDSRGRWGPYSSMEL